MSETVIELLEPDRVQLYWPEIVRQLNECPQVWRKWWTLDALYDAAAAHYIQCWAVGTEDSIHGMAFSRITELPTGSFFQVFLSCGHGLIEKADEIEATWERFADYHNCVMAEINGRPGWERVLKKRGFEKTSTTMSKSLTKAKVN